MYCQKIDKGILYRIMLNVKTAALENINGTNIDIRDDLKLTGKNILDSEKVETKTIENINGTEIDIQDNLDLNNNNIINVDNINTTTINNQVPVFGGGGGGSNGKYSQICLPPTTGQTIGSGQVKIDGDETSSISIVAGNSVGSLTFTSTELSLGASYHVKFAGTIRSDSKESINMTSYLGGENENNILFTTKIDNTDIKIDNLSGNVYVYECEFDFTVVESGSSGKIYSNGQILYVKGTSQNSLRGSSNETFLYKDLTSNLNIDIKIKWENSANNGEYIINKMFRITKMY